MHKLRYTIASIFSLALLIGCATKPSDIAPQYISELSYQGYTCEQMANEHGRLVNALSAASDAQWKARSNDTAGVMLLGLPTASLSGGNQAANIARLKGEIEAIEKAANLKNCIEVKPLDLSDLMEKPAK